MADTVTSQTIVNGSRNLIRKFTNESDGTGETAVTKVDATSATFGTPGTSLKIMRAIFAVSGGAVRVLWDASSDTDALILAGVGTLDYTFFGGLVNPSNTGATGTIQFTTVGFVAGSSYDITLEMAKS
jgi:hypothetical protein